jgi:hypothetical protein
MEIQLKGRLAGIPYGCPLAILYAKGAGVKEIPLEG